MSSGDNGGESLSRLQLQERLQLPVLHSINLWSKLVSRVPCGDGLALSLLNNKWPFHSWFELQRLHFEKRLNKRRFQHLRARAIRDHPDDPLEQKKRLFDDLCFGGATKHYATASEELKDVAIKSLPVDQVLHYRVHLTRHNVRSASGALSHKDMKVELKEPLWTGNRRLFRKFGSDRFLHMTFDEALLSCTPGGGCKSQVAEGSENSSPVGAGCSKCQQLADYLGLHVVGNQSTETHVFLTLAGNSANIAYHHCDTQTYLTMIVTSITILALPLTPITLCWHSHGL